MWQALKALPQTLIGILIRFYNRIGSGLIPNVKTLYTLFIHCILNNVKVPPTACLACLGIESLYTNISFDKAIKVIFKIFSGHPRLVLYLHLLRFVLKNNIFQFNDRIYHQVRGIAMGTTMAPALALVVVAYYEESYLENLQQRPLLWRRCIDDVLTIWPYTKGDSQKFFRNLNLVHPDLRFMTEISYTSVNFLDHLKRFNFFYRWVYYQLIFISNTQILFLTYMATCSLRNTF